MYRFVTVIKQDSGVLSNDVLLVTSHQDSLVGATAGGNRNALLISCWLYKKVLVLAVASDTGRFMQSPKTVLVNFVRHSKRRTPSGSSMTLKRSTVERHLLLTVVPVNLLVCFGHHP